MATLFRSIIWATSPLSADEPVLQKLLGPVPPPGLTPFPATNFCPFEPGTCRCCGNPLCSACGFIYHPVKRPQGLPADSVESEEPEAPV